MLNSAKTKLTRMWANAQRDGRPAEYRWRPLLNAGKFGWRPLLECRAVTLLIQESARLGRKVEFWTWQNSVTGQQPPKMYSIHNVQAQQMVKHRAKFGWLPLSNVAAVRKPRRETRLNLLGCPKLANRSQPRIVAWPSLPYYEDMWRRYCCLTSFRDFATCLSPQLRRYSPTNLCDGAQMAIFWRLFASCIFSEPRAARFRPAS